MVATTHYYASLRCCIDCPSIDSTIKVTIIRARPEVPIVYGGCAVILLAYTSVRYLIAALPRPSLLPELELSRQRFANTHPEQVKLYEKVTVD